MVDGTETKKLSDAEIAIVRDLLMVAHFDALTQMQKNITEVGGLVGMELAKLNHEQAVALSNILAKL